MGQNRPAQGAEKKASQAARAKSTPLEFKTGFDASPAKKSLVNLATGFQAFAQVATAALDKLQAASGKLSPEAAQTKLNELNTQYGDAKQKVEKYDKQLQRALLQYGPGMTADQKKEFIANFKTQHKEYAEAEKVLGEMKQFVSDNKDVLKKAALEDPNPRDANGPAGQLFQALNGMASDPSNAALLNEMLDGPRMIDQLSAGREQAFVDEFIPNLTAGLVGDGLKAGLEDKAALAEARQKLAGTLDQLAEKLGNSQLKDTLKTGLDTLKKLTEGLKNPDDKALYEHIQKLNKELDASTPSPLQKVVAGAAFLVGVGMVATGAIAGDRDQLVQGLLQTGSNLQGGVYGLELASKLMPNIIKSSTVEALGKIAGPLSSVIGALSSAAAFVGNLQGLEKNDVTSLRAEAAGNFAAAVGGVMMLIPGGQVPGVIVSAVGAALTLLSGQLKQQEQAAENATFDAEFKGLMSNLHPPVKQEVIDALGKMDPSVSMMLNDSMKLTAADWEKLATDHPDFLSSLDLGIVLNLQRGLGVTSAAELENVIQGIPKDKQKETMQALASLQADRFMNTISKLGLNPSEALALITSAVRNNRLGDPAYVNTSLDKLYQVIEGKIELPGWPKDKVPRTSDEWRAYLATARGAMGYGGAYLEAFDAVLSILGKRR